MLPVIAGMVRPDSASGSRLVLRHRLAWAIWLFAGLWLSVTGSLAVAVLRAGLSGWYQPGFWRGVGALDSAELLLLPGLFLAGLLLFTIPFWREVDKSRALLVATLQLAKIQAA